MAVRRQNLESALQKIPRASRRGKTSKCQNSLVGNHFALPGAAIFPNIPDAYLGEIGSRAKYLALILRTIPPPIVTMISCVDIDGLPAQVPHLLVASVVARGSLRPCSPLRSSCPTLAVLLHCCIAELAVHAVHLAYQPLRTNLSYFRPRCRRGRLRGQKPK